MSCPYNPADEGAQMGFDGRMSYGDYLQLDSILNAQHPRSTAHDEMLFIIQHQTSELWLRLALHEIDAARECIRNDKLQPAFKMLARVSRIFEQLNNAWDVLRTLTPSEYTEFREDLGQSSGFQSHQYRLIEFALGNRNEAMLKPHAHREDLMALLEAELEKPSLYQEALRLLHRSGFALPEEVINARVRNNYSPHQAVEAAWLKIYENPSEHWTLYELAEKFIDLEDYFRRWRFNHVTTVERIIGFKRGSGGTGGVSYLRRMLDVELFPELWHLRTNL